MRKKQNIAIIGGGIGGLSLAYFLAPFFSVTLFEKEKFLGGLAAGFQEPGWQWPLEHFYHHFFPSDKETKKLLKELEIPYFFHRPRSALYWQGNIYYPFDSPISFLRFPLLPLSQKIRTGAFLASLKLLPTGKIFSRHLATKILPPLMGQKSYQILWKPLFANKFGPEAKEISASWFWARIKKRSASLGYIKGGFPFLVKRLEEEIKKRGGEIIKNHPIKSIKELDNFSQIIATVPVSTFLKITPLPSSPYRHQLKSIKNIAALNLVIVSKKPFLDNHTYWLNINDQKFPFVVVVEHTNFIPRRFYGGKYLFYVGGYYPPHHPFLHMNKREILSKFFPYLKKINPSFSQKDIQNYHLYQSLYAQPIFTPSYPKLIPSFRTPLPNLYLSCLEQTYPWDRGVNYALKNARQLAKMIKYKRK